MTQLFTCYSPSGVKFELTRPNFLDCTQHFGFTTSRPAGAVDEVEVEVPVDDAEDELEASDAAADEDVDKAPVDDDEGGALEFVDKDAVKAYLRSANIPFDGRASFDDLVALAQPAA